MIRSLSETDIPACIAIVDAVWGFEAKFQPPQLAAFFKRAYTEESLAASNYNIVVGDKGRVEGFLFGKCGSGDLYKNAYSGTAGQLRFLFQFYTLKGLPFREKQNYLRIMVEHEMNRRKVEPHRLNEVNLFAVHPGAQGKGFGRLLMNAFIEHCRANGVSRITLDTDRECNYGFYRHIGFTVKGEFYSPLQHKFSGTSGDSYVYELRL